MDKNKIGWQFDNSYSRLSENLKSKLQPVPVKAPKIVLFNQELSKELGLDFSSLDNNELALLFSGNKLPEGSETIAQAYAGHQFGHFTILGDGRALMIGEHINNNIRYDIQFKGSGKTPYSRNADGRAALGPMLREYIISESMHHLGVPTTRSLAVVSTGEKVIRETNLDGAILTRVASSHIRVGTFQLALITKNKNDLKTLFDYTINRHYPQLKNFKNPAVELLKVVMEKQIDLICNWMRIGFVHGVMNTDNMTVSGETIDYGPCAFMDKYDPGTVFSSIDQFGRYAYFNQPSIAKWNLERFAECLLPIIDENEKRAIKLATETIISFKEKYEKKWFQMMRNKLGIINEDENDKNLFIELLTWMHENNVDYTNTFCHLMNELKHKDNVYEKDKFVAWKEKWEKRRMSKNNTPQNSLNLMRKSNPLVIPRNHLVELALKDATDNNELKKINDLLRIIKIQNVKDPLLSNYQNVSSIGEKKYVTYCGT